MNEQEEKVFVDSTLCAWCGIPLGSANTVRESVCIRCYELLIKANLTNEEIFNPSRTNRKNDCSTGLRADDGK